MYFISPLKSFLPWVMIWVMDSIPWVRCASGNVLFVDLICYKFPPRPRPNTTYPYKYCFYGYHEENEQTVRLCNFLPWIYLSFVNYFAFFFLQNILYFLLPVNYPFVQTSPKLPLRNLIMDLFTQLSIKWYIIVQNFSDFLTLL